MTVRGESKANEDLQRFIDVANTDPRVPDIHELFYGAIDAPGRDESVSERELWVKVCAEIVPTLSPATRGFLGPPEELGQFLNRYALLVSARDVLRGLADRYRSKIARKTFLTVYDKSFSADLPVSVTVNLVVNEDGFLSQSDERLLAALVGVRADRIRSCEVCNRLFWAPRVNSECCSERCRKTFNQRTSRKDRRERMAKRKGSKKGR